MNQVVLCLMACGVAAVAWDPPIGPSIGVWAVSTVAKPEVAKLNPPQDALSQKAATRDVTSYEAARTTSDGDWQAADGENERILQDALEVGNEEGLPLYPCRGAYKGGMQLGRMRADFRGCHIGYDGRETEVVPYEVLTVN